MEFYRFNPVSESRGALPPTTDVRDYKVAAMAANFPKSFELAYTPKVKNQRNVGSCVAHTASEVLEYFNKIETGSEEQLSTDFIYGMQGVQLGRLEGGMYLRDACKIVKEYGDCLKSTISTNTEQPECTHNLNGILNEEIYTEAANYKVESYAKCTSSNSMKQALMNHGPLLASTKWYDKYIITKDNIIIFDDNSDYGYHAIMIYGWNENGWLCQNSWGKNWNKNGKFVLPFDRVAEAWSFVDANSTDVRRPIRNSLFDIIYKVLNKIILLLKK